MANSYTVLKDKEQFVIALCGALARSDQSAARNLLIQRADFISDLTEVDCRYALHALFLTLVRDNPVDILSKMSSGRIDRLKNALVNVKKYSCPDKTELENGGRLSGTQLAVSGKYAKSVNTVKRYSMLVASYVADFWDDVSGELDKWLNAIEEYQRNALVATASKENVSKDEKKVKKEVKKVKKAKSSSGQKNKKRTKMKRNTSLLSVQELADKLEMSVAQLKRKKDYVLKKYPEFKATMEGYFTKKSGAKYFCAEYFDEFAKMLDTIKHYKPRAAKETKVVDVPAVDPVEQAQIKAKLAEVVVQDGQMTTFVEAVMPVKPAELTGIVGLQKILDGFLKSYQIARNELDAANKECDVLLERTKECKDPQERTKLLALSQQANDRILKCMAVSEGKKDECELVSGLLKQAEEDSEAARKASQKWEKTLAQVNVYIEFYNKTYVK